MIALGLLAIALGAFCQASYYVPINKVKGWSWESFWMVYAFFGWVVFPFLGVLMAVTPGHSFFDLYTMDPRASLLTFIFGLLYGVGGLTFGLSMRYLGVALGQSIALGLCSALGVVLTPLATDLLGLSEGMLSTLTGAVLAGMAVSTAGIAIIGIAGRMRAGSAGQDAPEEQRFNFGKGILVAVLSGFMSACCSIGLGCGAGMYFPDTAPVLRTMPAMLLVMTGAFLVNAAYCSWRNCRNKRWDDFSKGRPVLRNLLFCVLAGLIWSTQLYGLSAGRGFFRDSPAMLAFSWAILMSLSIVFSNLWGIILKEWKGVSRKAVAILISGIVILIFSTFLPQLI